MTRAWRIAARNLRRNRRRNLATGLAVALGFAGLALLGGYVTRVEAFLRTNAVYLQHGGHVTVYRAGALDRVVSSPARYSLDEREQALILEAAEGDGRVSFTAPYVKAMGLAGNGCRSVPFLALGIDPAAARRILAHPDVTTYSADLARPLRGRHPHDGTQGADHVGLALGLATRLGKTRVLDEFEIPPEVRMPDCSAPDWVHTVADDANLQLAGLTHDGALGALDVDVVSVFHTPSLDTEDQVLHAPLATLRRLYASDAASYVALFLHDWRDAAPAAAGLRARLASAGLDVDVFTFDDERVNPYYVGTMAFLRSMAGFILLIVVAVVVLGVANAATLTVFERSRELGTLRALGYTRRQAAGLLVREVVLVTIVGTAAGAALALGAAAAIHMGDIRISPPGVPGTMQVVVTPGPAVLAVVAALLLAFTVLVAWGVARRRLAERPSNLLTAINA
jgi:putative ABC transport system permease protein